MVNVLEEKKGENILLLDIHELVTFTDYFLICTGTSDRMLDGLADAVDQEAKKTYDVNAKIQGNSSSGWIVVDLGDVVLHLFSPDQRDYYRLEQLWEKGKVLLSLK